jgi:hypothetical protein
VIKVYAHHYLEMGRALQFWMTGEYANLDAPFPDQFQHKFRSDMNDLLVHSRQLDLKVTRGIVAHYGSLVGTNAISGQVARDIAGEVQRVASVEMESRLFFVMSPGNDAYWPEDMNGKRVSVFGEEVEEQFPDAVLDIDEASRCAAFQRYTACVFHLMRVTESGLKRLANLLGIPYAPSWESYIKQIGSSVEKDWKDKSAEWKSNEQFYKELLGDLQAVKLAWRNPTMHIVRNYGPDEAAQIFSATKIFMARLTTKLRVPN